MDIGNFTLFYSGNKNNNLRTGFLVDRNYKHLVICFEPVSEGICLLRVRAQFFNISFLCVYAPAEDAGEEEEDAFYEKLEEIYFKSYKYDVKIILGE